MRRAAFVRVGCVTLANRFQSGCRYLVSYGVGLSLRSDRTFSFFLNRIRDAATWVAAFQKGRRYLDGEYGSYYRIYCFIHGPNRQRVTMGCALRQKLRGMKRVGRGRVAEGG